jgi:multisubunit Na+/H+ antiporter MnhE subunit
VTAALLRIGGLVAIYLLVLTSLSPGDVVVGAGLALALVLVVGATGPARPPSGWMRWLVGVARMLAATGWEMVLGTARVVRFCVSGAGSSPGFVEIPRGDRSRHAVALWGVLTGEAPDEYPVAVDDRRHLLIVHVIDARDADAIRARHEAARDRHLRDVVP